MLAGWQVILFAGAALAALAVWPEFERIAAGRLIPRERRGRAAAGGEASAVRRVAGRLAPAPSAGGWLRFAAVLVALAPIPLSARLVAADLDAGLAAVLAAGLLALVGASLDEPRRLAERMPVVAAGAVTLGVAMVPVIARVASLNLSDVVIAQQGGLGNWFAWRDPFLLVAAVGFVAAATCLRPPAAPGDDDPAGPAAWTLVSSLLASCLFFGGWWAFVPALDRWPLLHLGLKTASLAAVQVWWRGRLPRPADPTAGQPPVRLLLLLTLGAATASYAWLVLSGEVR